MTTIIVKNADFSGGRLAHYLPPVDGATLCAFVGDQDDSASLRNFGSGGDLQIGAGYPASVDEAFRRFSHLHYLKSDAFRTESTTLLAVYRSVTPLTGHGVVIASERDVADGGRRGCALVRNNTTENLYVAAFGTAANNTVQNLSSNLPAAASPAFVAGVVEPYAPTGVKLKSYRMTPTVATGPLTSNALANIAPAADEASFPFRIGNNYRGVVMGEIDIGFVAVYPRALTVEEMEALYQSVKRRFAALGVSL